MKFPEYKQIVNLIPGGCPQFLDFRLDADSMKREMRSFREETADKSQGGLYEHYLRCLVEDDPEERPGELVDMRESRGTRPAGSPRPKSFASDYEVSLQESLECFKGEWMPLPFLRITARTGPTGKAWSSAVRPTGRAACACPWRTSPASGTSSSCSTPR